MEYTYIASIALGTLSNMIIGSLWYSDLLFGKSWRQETGMHQLTGNALTQAMLCTLLCAFIMSTGITYFIGQLSITTIPDALKFALYAWCAFTATTSLPGCFFAKKTILTWIIDSSYYLIAMSMMSIIVVLINQ